MLAPPAVLPEFGETDEIVGKRYANPLVLVAVEPSEFITTTLTRPGAWAGVVTERNELPDWETAIPGVPPNVTIAPGANADPLIDTDVPPPLPPVLGETKEMVG